ncbi:hypothetical protein ACWIB8_01575 [Corynebacterium flavescens]
MNPRVLAAASLLTLPLLTGCQLVDSTVDYFGPRPDENLEKLAHRAQEDSLALASIDAEAASVRARQADELYSEISRLCGTIDGAAPRSCAVEKPTAPGAIPPGDSPATEILQSAADLSIAGLGTVHVESRPLVVEQAIELEQQVSMSKASSASSSQEAEAAEADAKESLPALPGFKKGTDPAVSDGATDLLNWEYMQLFALDFARSYADSGLLNTIDSRLRDHEERIRALQGALAPLGPVPQPAPAYQPAAEPLPINAEEAQAFVEDLADSDSQKWASAASTQAEKLKSEDSLADWRSWLIAVAAQSRSY